MHRRVTLISGLVAAITGCGDNDHIDDHLRPFFDWNGQSTVGSIEIDARDASNDEPMLRMMPKPMHPSAVLMLYGHVPGQSVSLDTIETVLATARDQQLELLTFADLAEGGEPRSGISLSFDDNSVDEWFGMLDLLERYDAHVTFFVTKYAEMTGDQKAKLHALADAGNSIEAHGKEHLHGVDYVAAHGLEAYLEDEVRPSIEVLRADGFTPRAFAYPYGERTREMDDAIAELLPVVRGISTFPH